MGDDFYDAEGDGRYPRDRRRKCIYCETRIPRYMMACKTHFPWYLEYREEQFQKELIAQETKRMKQEDEDWIVANEGVDNLPDEGRPVLTKEQVDQIYSLHDEGFGYMKIGKLMGIPTTTVAYYFSGKSKKHKSRYGHEERRRRVEQYLESAEQADVSMTTDISMTADEY
jgi:hypothetical protein